MTTGQSKEARLERLSEGRCPIHGLSMDQVEGPSTDADGKPFVVEECPRNDCRIRAKAFYEFDGPRALLEEFWYLI